LVSLQLSGKTVRWLINNGKLSVSKVGDRFGRIKESDVELYLQNHINGKKGVELK
jgi:excisionase family DNA binding protein